MKLYSLILLSSVCFIYGCDDCESIENIHYRFVNPMTLTPAQDTFNIGDTITVEYAFSDMMLDSNSLQTFHLPDINFENTMYLYKIDENPAVRGVHFADILPHVGSFTPFNGSFGGKYIVKPLYTDNTYNFKAQLILRKVGVFWFTLVANFNKDLDGYIELQGECDAEYAVFHHRLNGTDENNYNLLLSAPDTLINSSTQVQFNNTAGYCFVVVE